MLTLESDRLFINADPFARNPAALCILAQFVQHQGHLPERIFCRQLLWTRTKIIKAHVPAKVFPTSQTPDGSLVNLFMERSTEDVIAKYAVLILTQEPILQLRFWRECIKEEDCIHFVDLLQVERHEVLVFLPPGPFCCCTRIGAFQQSISVIEPPFN